MLDVLLRIPCGLAIGALVGCVVAIGPVLAVRARKVLRWLIPVTIVSLSWLYATWRL